VGYQTGILRPTSFDFAGNVTALTASATAGQNVRVCLSWDSTVSGGPTYGTDALLADYDLYVYGPTGALVATSASGIQSFEIVQFVAPSTGFYLVKVHRFSQTSASEYYGLAFTTTADM
jgi:hypothetical protein